MYFKLDWAPTTYRKIIFIFLFCLLQSISYAESMLPLTCNSSFSFDEEFNAWTKFQYTCPLKEESGPATDKNGGFDILLSQLEDAYQQSGLDWLEVSARVSTLSFTAMITKYATNLGTDRRNSIVLSQQTKTALLALNFLLTATHLTLIHFNQKQYYGWFINIINIPNLLVAAILPTVNWYRNRGLLPERPPGLPISLFSAEQRANIFAGLIAKIKEGPGNFMNTLCLICNEDYMPVEAISHLDCGHDFHATCLNEWFKTLPQNACAACRK